MVFVTQWLAVVHGERELDEPWIGLKFPPFGTSWLSVRDYVSKKYKVGRESFWLWRSKESYDQEEFEKVRSSSK